MSAFKSISKNYFFTARTFQVLATFILLFGFTGILLAQSGQAPAGDKPLMNDHCIKAWPVKVGEKLMNLSNKFATAGPANEIPPSLPYTCIESFENDLWFKFVTDNIHTLYEIEIEYVECNTPAGLQAMLIEAEGCELRRFNYKVCVNTESMKPIRLMVEEKNPGTAYLIHIDGFDGTICDFTLHLKGSTDGFSVREYYSNNRYGYDFEFDPAFEPVELSSTFQNNSYHLDWTTSPDDNASFFVVQRIINLPNGNKVSKVMAILDPVQTAGGMPINYDYADVVTRFSDEEECCYRVIKVNENGERFYSKIQCQQAKIVKGFFMGEIGSTQEKGFFAFTYINYKKKKDFIITVKDSKGNIVKQTELRKEPARDGNITIDMRDFSDGEYVVRMQNEEDYFDRKFLKH